MISLALGGQIAARPSFGRLSSNFEPTFSDVLSTTARCSAGERPTFDGTISMTPSPDRIFLVTIR